MRITIEQAIGTAAIDAFYPLYVAAFDPIRTRAAARHMLTAEEFAAEMTDERIDKYVVWHADGAPMALMTLATDLTAVPWISPEYFAARYPDHLGRGAVYYLGYTLVHPQHASQGVFTLITDRLEERLTEARAVCAFDVCAYNDARNVGRRVAALVSSGGATVDALDVQTYYAADFAAPVAAAADFAAPVAAAADFAAPVAAAADFAAPVHAGVGA